MSKTDDFLGRLDPSARPPVVATAGPSAPPRPPDAHAMIGRRFGVDIDGTTVRVVEVVDDAVASFASYHGHSAHDAFQQFLETRPQGAITVVWSEADFHLRRMPLPNLPTAALRAGLLDAIEDTLPMAPGSSIVAARVVPSRADGSYQATVAAADRLAVGELWHLVQVPSARLVPAPLLFTEDGLYLGLRDGGAQLLLAVGGAAIAARSLAAGGLATVRDALSDGEQSPEERLVTISRGGTRLDPGAAAAVDKYSQAISDEVRRTADFWARQGMSVPSEIFVHGQGIALPNLAGKLLDSAFLAKAAPMPRTSLDAIARADLPRAYLALLATQFNPAVQVLADYPDPHAADRVRRRFERTRIGRKMVLVGVGALALLGALIAPVVLAKREVSNAEDAQAAVEQELAGLHSVVSLDRSVLAGQRTFKQDALGDVKWGQFLDELRASAPADAAPVFESLSAERKGKAVSATFSVTLQGCDPAAVATWLRSLTALGVKEPWTTSVRCERGAPAGGSDVMRAAFVVTRPVDDVIAANRTPKNPGMPK
jgi:hypothetical protein